MSTRQFDTSLRQCVSSSQDSCDRSHFFPAPENASLRQKASLRQNFYFNQHVCVQTHVQLVPAEYYNLVLEFIFSTPQSIDNQVL